jgi:tetratricopeptide (TPR) repeat protein
MRTVARSERLDAQEGFGLPSGTPLTLASQMKLAGSLRATRLVTGTYKFDPANGVTVTGYLIDAALGTRLWDASRPGTLAKIFGLMDPIVLKAADFDRDRLSRVPLNAITSVADPPLPIFEVIVRSQQEADPDRRVTALEKGLDMNSKSPALLRALAFALYDAGRNADAIARIDAIPDGSLPDAWRLHLLRARILMVRNDTDAAIAALSKSIAAGNSADAHVYLARVLIGRGDRVRAQTEIDVAAALDPGHPEIPEVRSILTGRAT